MECASCGAPLQGDPLSLSFVCGYCGATTYNPESISNHLKSIDHSKVNNHLKIALSHFEAAEYAKSLECFEHALTEDSSNLDGWLYSALAVAYSSNLQNFEHNIDVINAKLKRAFEISPDSDIANNISYSCKDIINNIASQAITKTIKVAEKRHYAFESTDRGWANREYSRELNKTEKFLKIINDNFVYDIKLNKFILEQINHIRPRITDKTLFWANKLKDKIEDQLKSLVPDQKENVDKPAGKKSTIKRMILIAVALIFLAYGVFLFVNKHTGNTTVGTTPTNNKITTPAGTNPSPAPKVSTPVAVDNKANTTSNINVYNNLDTTNTNTPNQNRQNVSSSQPITNNPQLKALLAGAETLSKEDAIKIASSMNNKQPALNAKLADAFNKIGLESLNKQGDKATALENFKKAYENDKSNPEYSGNYGYALFLTGNFDEAIQKFVESLETGPKRASAWFSLGDVCGAKGLTDVSYQSLLNACKFTRNINTTKSWLQNKSENSEFPSMREAAARALTFITNQEANPQSPMIFTQTESLTGTYKVEAEAYRGGLTFLEQTLQYTIDGKNAQGPGAKFAIDVGSPSGTGSISGVAIKFSNAKYISKIHSGDPDDICTLVFDFSKNGSVKIEEGNCSAYHGVPVQFANTYKKVSDKVSFK